MSGIEDKSKLFLQKEYVDFLSEVYQKHVKKTDDDKVYDEQTGTYAVNAVDIKEEKISEAPPITLLRMFLRTPIKADEKTSVEIQFKISKFAKNLTQISMIKLATFSLYNFNNFGLEETIRERLSKLEHSELPIKGASVCMAAPKGQTIIDEEPQKIRRMIYITNHPGHPDLKLKGCEEDQWILENLISREKPAKFEVKFQPTWSLDLGTVGFVLAIVGLTLTIIKFALT